jgi:Protein of unknown function (DUF3089)
MLRSLCICLIFSVSAFEGPVVAQLADLSPPRRSFDDSSKPPAPDYKQKTTWAVWPGVPSKADTVPAGSQPERAVQPDADVFFVHPTTYLGNEAWNAAYDAGGVTGQQLDEVVLGYQASVFNACCRMYAPRYRQATISAFLRPNKNSFKAYNLAYSDVVRAFDYYIANENNGRPFILASHSQGSLHATRLIQERIVGRPDLRKKLVVAYVVGASLPGTIAFTGLPVCKTRTQTGCLIDWNSASALTPLALGRGLMVSWSDRRYQTVGLKRWLCVNPLSWSQQKDASAAENRGALPFAGLGAEIPALRAGVTGARCARGRLIISVSDGQDAGFTDTLTKLGSYHNLDYALFYDSVRRNAVERVAAHRSDR